MIIPTVKIADADCPNGFRIINVSDRQPEDVEFVEGEAVSDKPAKAKRQSKDAQ